ncbi:TetR/AcrR family transcriptional regulator [Alisedimentitalea sp. MJ-SS2]|uniref:TetR/AcrR family transcriptional regulator n=1 Tax=Aliisedimentitalea sp. MJ-SS2 TaxID=3049795 RepID=UPI0029154DB9|nr:TetR/AcrR family transcriptional regulator [Alisedimentitalea sp. MJ-SS2]MDU8928797.1 TetR/AcrR family transcriptional regulator [Alisedimentitalea sp. MJ-SS2]
MPDTPASATQANATGLRGRKKARRRQEILRSAEHLFARDGVEAATMAAIAERAGVSPPTVFNYFGSKENILHSLIFEGTRQKRRDHMSLPRKTGIPFAQALGEFLCEFTENTLQIAGKRVWRYAEATNIRRPDSDFGRQFAVSDNELMKLVNSFMSDYDVVLSRGDISDLGLVAQLFFDRWTVRYFEFIKDDSMTLQTHFGALRQDVDTMVALFFDPGFAAHSPLANTEESQ